MALLRSNFGYHIRSADPLPCARRLRPPSSLHLIDLHFSPQTARPLPQYLPTMPMRITWATCPTSSLRAPNPTQGASGAGSKPRQGQAKRSKGCRGRSGDGRSVRGSNGRRTPTPYLGLGKMETASSGGGGEPRGVRLVEVQAAVALQRSKVFHVVKELLGFVLYMHHQIPSIQ